MGGASVVVVGAGQAGCQVAVSLREQGHDGPITVLGAEGVPPYQRPPLTKAYLAGRTDLAGLTLRAEKFYSDQDIDLLPGDPVVAIDRPARVVVLRSGRALGYGHLVLATGARPRSLPVRGAGLDGVLTLRTVADADAVRAGLRRTGQRIVVVGAGFVGLEFAAVAREQGHHVTVVEALPRAMARGLSEHTAEHLVGVHRERGVQVLLGTSVAAVYGDGHVRAVELSDGETLPADLVLVGIGVLPNVELARNAGLAVDDGIVVDAHLRTLDPAIHAVGDCASFSSVHAGKRIRLESVQNAVEQATCAAAGILGSAEPYTGLPWFFSDQYDLKVQIAGLTDGYDRVVVTGDPAGGRFSVFCFGGERLLGVESVNKPLDHVMARRLLASGDRIAPDLVAVPGFDLRAHLQPAA